MSVRRCYNQTKETKENYLMKKIAINVCYGGFSLSPKAVKRLAELQGRECYFFENDLPVDFPENDLFWFAYDLPNLPNSVGYSELSAENKQKWNEEYSKHCIDIRPNNREDPLLIQVIEELKEEANGGVAAKIKIVEIPDDIEYEINKYDGYEYVAEKHRKWN